jgi:hypothetical protein
MQPADALVSSQAHYGQYVSSGAVLKRKERVSDVYGDDFTCEPDLADRHAVKRQRVADQAQSQASAKVVAFKEGLARAAALRCTILPPGEYQHDVYADVGLIASDTLTGAPFGDMWVASCSYKLVTADALGAESAFQPPCLYQNGSLYSKTVLSSAAAVERLETTAPFLAHMVEALRHEVVKAMRAEYGTVNPVNAYCVLLFFKKGWIARHRDRKPASTARLEHPERGWARLIVTLSGAPTSPPKNLIFERSAPGGKTQEAFAVSQASGGVTVTSSLLRGEDKLPNEHCYQHMHDNQGDHISIILDVPSGMDLDVLDSICRGVLEAMQRYTDSQGGLRAMQQVPRITQNSCHPLYHQQTSHKCFAHRRALRIYTPWRLRRSSIRTGFLLGQPPYITRSNRAPPTSRSERASTSHCRAPPA